MMQYIFSDTADYMETSKDRAEEDKRFEFVLAKRKQERDAFLSKIRQRKESFTLRFSGFLATVVKPFIEDFKLKHPDLLVEYIPTGVGSDGMTVAYAIAERTSGLSFVIEIQCNAGSEEILCGCSFFNMQETTFYTGFEIKSIQLSNYTLQQIELILAENLKRIKKKISVEKSETTQY